jgi:hypothetical protein
MAELGDRLKLSWWPLIRDLEANLMDASGPAVVEIKILVNQQGLPLLWTKPAIKELHPRRDMGKLLDLLG